MSAVKPPDAREEAPGTGQHHFLRGAEARQANAPVEVALRGGFG